MTTPIPTACPDCGKRTHLTQDAEVVEVEVFTTTPSGTPNGRAVHRMVRCKECDARLDRAGVLSLALGNRGVTIDGFRLMRKTAIPAIHQALSALAVVGASVADHADPDDVRGVVRAVYEATIVASADGSVGSLSVFASAFVDGEAKATEPWAHVSDETRVALRRVAARMIAARVARPGSTVEIPCPTRACLYCGVGSVVRDAKATAFAGGPKAVADEVWIPASTKASALGGAGSRPITGHVCPACDYAVDSAGGHGRSARVQSWLTYHGSKQHPDFVVVGKLPGWGVLEGRKPSKRRWAHGPNPDTAQPDSDALDRAAELREVG